MDKIGIGPSFRSNTIIFNCDCEGLYINGELYVEAVVEGYLKLSLTEAIEDCSVPMVFSMEITIPVFNDIYRDKDIIG